jgi:hypothetical protein
MIYAVSFSLLASRCTHAAHLNALPFHRFWHTAGAFALLCLGILGMEPIPATAQVPPTLYLKSADSFPQGVTYQFSLPQMKATAEQPLPPPAPDGWFALPVPAEYRREGAELHLIQTAQGRMAIIPIGRSGQDVAGVFRNANALFEGNLLSEADRRQQDKLWNDWARMNAISPERWRSQTRSGPNLLQNPRFTAGTGNWYLSLAPTASAQFSLPEEATLPRGARGKVARIQITAKGDKTYAVQWLQDGVALAEGKPYTFSFWAKADRDRPAKCHLLWPTPVMRDGKNEYPCVGLLRLFNLTTQWQKFSFTFLAMNVTSTHKLGFTLGDSEGTVEFADLSLRSGIDSRLLEEAQPVAGRVVSTRNFNQALSLQIPIEFQGKRVEGARVTLRGSGRIYGSAPLAKWDNGIARFQKVPIGQRLDLEIQFEGQKHMEDIYLKENSQGAPEKSFLLAPVQLPSTWTNVRTLDAPVQTPPIQALPEETPPAHDRTLLRSIIISAILIFIGASGILLAIYMRKRNIVPAPEQVVQNKAIVPTEARKPLVFSNPTQAESSSLPVSTAEQLAHPPVLENGPRLVGMRGHYAGYTFPLREICTTIGREKSNAISLIQDDSTSRRHANIEIVEGKYLLTDEGSSNGVFVNGVRLPTSTPYVLHAGDELEIGRTTFRFEV